MFLQLFPGLSWRDVDDMPYDLWERCKAVADQQIEQRSRG